MAFFFLGSKHKKHKPIVQFVLLGVFVNAPHNKDPYNVWINALSVIFNYRYDKIQSLKGNMKNLGINPHGLTNQKSKQVSNKEEEVANMKNRLHIFLKG